MNFFIFLKPDFPELSELKQTLKKINDDIARLGSDLKILAGVNNEEYSKKSIRMNELSERKRITLEKLDKLNALEKNATNVNHVINWN